MVCPPVQTGSGSFRFCKKCGAIIHRPDDIAGAWKQRSCEKCVKKMSLDTKKRWRERHPEKMQACRDNWNAKNKNRRKKKTQEWAKKNRNRLNLMARIRYKNNDAVKTYYNEYRRKKVRTDPNYKIRAVLRSRLSVAMRAAKTSKSANTLSLLGCSIDEFKKHIESQFLPGMSWENHSYDGWHLDHLIPCAAFDLTDTEQQKKCFHYSNIRPLWADENFRKQGKIIS